jgi:peptide/nickel transport system permease protein
VIVYVVRRIFLAALVVLGVFVLTFIVSHVVPSDPARLYAGGARASEDEVREARATLGLDKPLPTQFAVFVSDAVRGNFGTSFVTKKPVTADLSVFVPASLELIIPAMLLAFALGVPIGLLAGAARNHPISRISNVVAIGGAALPLFWVALVAQLIFAVSLRVLPVGARVGTETTLFHPVKHITGFNLIDAAITGNWAGWVDSLNHMLLPVAVLTIYPLSLVIRQTGASVSQVMTSTYVTAVRASGLPERTVLFRFVLKNAIVPTLTVLGLTFAGSLTGVVLVETIFSWPGIGRYLTDAILASDYPVILAVTILGAVAYVVINLVVDLLQAAIDPRVRLGGSQ